MGQSWIIYNIDKGMKLGFTEEFGLAFAEGREAASLAKLLPSAAVKFPKDPLEGQPYIEARKYKSSQTGICDLPCELQDAIFSELRDPVDVVAFCLTASHFWRIGLSHYKALYMDHVRHAEDWSGDRLICMGDDTQDRPDGLITNEHFELLITAYFYRHYCAPYGINELLGEFSQSLCKRQWPHTCNFTQRCKLTKRNPLSRQRQKRLKKSRVSLDDEPANDLPEFLPLFKKYVPERHCVLRNLSQKVYVRQDALALKSDADASVYYMSFGSLVLARIAWSTDSGMAMAYATEHDLHRGVWAGDRFDVVNMEAIEHDDGWTDVGAGARKQLNEMWEDRFGSGWENKVRKWEL
ncbi:hypothetical protein BDZ89DRAFT_1067172 [Hymenopellis radicata]|nr:hypothetical protein BDZ89DRAFT_1067172 [Hymenopellis radicata]